MINLFGVRSVLSPSLVTLRSLYPLVFLEIVCSIQLSRLVLLTTYSGNFLRVAEK